MPSLRQRIGVGLAQIAPIEAYPQVASWRLGWYLDWSININPVHPGGAEYVQTLWALEEGGLAEAVAANPGSLWQASNEPENVWQGAMTPLEYAELYHDAYHFIKNIDPAARIALGAVTCPTPLRLEWLDLVLTDYQTIYGVAMPIDVLNIHVYPLTEEKWLGMSIPVGLDDYQSQPMYYTAEDGADPQIFEQLVRAFRQWAYDRGYGDKPLIISEMGLLVEGDFSEQRQCSYMDATFGFLSESVDSQYGYTRDGGRLVQKWAWFPLNDWVRGGALIGPDGGLTYVGENFVKWLMR